MRSLFNDTDWKLIKASIDESERKTVAEIVVISAPKSASYAYQRLAGALLLTITFGFILMLLPFRLPKEFTVLGEVFLVAVFWWICGWAPLLMMLTPEHIARRAVERNAKVLFIDRGLTETINRTGILILISQMERRVYVLADKGIRERVRTLSWSNMINHMTAAIRMGKATQGICEAISMITNYASNQNSDLKRGRNELSNEPIVL